eukprot:1196429-Prorocentrum_minimum.AAC.14
MIPGPQLAAELENAAHLARARKRCPGRSPCRSRAFMAASLLLDRSCAQKGRRRCGGAELSSVAECSKAEGPESGPQGQPIGRPAAARRRGPPRPGWSTGHEARATQVALGGPASELAYEVLLGYCPQP